jgi:hypothetical protein
MKQLTRVAWPICLWWLALAIMWMSAFKVHHLYAPKCLDERVVKVLHQQADSASRPAGNDQRRLKVANADAASVLDKYFPQSGHCGDGRWRQRYAELHHAVVSGLSPPRYLTSVAVQSGLGDRITGVARVRPTVRHETPCESVGQAVCKQQTA